MPRTPKTGRNEWQAADIATLRRMHAADCTDEQIAVALGRSHEGVRKKRKKLGLQPHRDAPRGKGEVTRIVDKPPIVGREGPKCRLALGAEGKTAVDNLLKKHGVEDVMLAVMRARGLA